jgi:hypothetical protein
MVSGTIFAASNLLLPYSADLATILAFQTISGVASGTFIPLTIGFVIQNLPTQLVIYGVAAYSMNIELSLNISASVEGWFVDYWSWQWIFWDTALVMPLMLACVYFGMPWQKTNRSLLKGADWWGMLYASLGLSIIYAALDQGNRLDWLQSGLINGLLLAGVILLAAFVVHELTHDGPWLNLRFVIHGNFPLLMLYIVFFASSSFPRPPSFPNISRRFKITARWKPEACCYGSRFRNSLLRQSWRLPFVSSIPGYPWLLGSPWWGVRASWRVSSRKIGRLTTFCHHKSCRPLGKRSL